MTDATTRVLVTGAGGPAGIAVILAASADRRAALVGPHAGNAAGPAYVGGDEPPAR